MSDTLYYGASLLFEPSPNFDAQFSYDHSKLVWNPETLNMTPEDGFLFCDTFTQAARSEEHTSELQSLMRISYAVFCLKKKNNKNITTRNTSYNRHTTKKQPIISS